MKKQKITQQDYLKAHRKASREEEIARHGRPARFRAVHKSKKAYDRKREKAGLRNLPFSFHIKINTWREDKFERSVANGTETVFVTLRFCVVRKQLKATLKPNAAGVQLQHHYYRNG